MGLVWEEKAAGGARVERRDAAEARRRILSVARQLFAERGVTEVSMHRIGRVAGVGQGTLYRHFEHKGALCSALLAEEIGELSSARCSGGRRVGGRRSGG